MSPAVQMRLIRIIILSIVAFIIGAGWAFWDIRNNPGASIDKGSRSVPVAGVKIGGPFTLTDHNGKVVTDQDYAGSYKLIYFGFTFCPSICPTELQKMTKAMNALGEQSKAVQPLFITIDPERDTVDVMKDYISLFGSRFVGLTGTTDQIGDVLKSYRVFAQKAQDPSMDEYTMDHSSFIYFMSPEGDLLAIYRVQDSADTIADDIRRRIFQ